MTKTKGAITKSDFEDKTVSNQQSRVGELKNSTEFTETVT